MRRSQTAKIGEVWPTRHRLSFRELLFDFIEFEFLGSDGPW